MRCKYKCRYDAPFCIRMGIFRIHIHVANICINKYQNDPQKLREGIEINGRESPHCTSFSRLLILEQCPDLPIYFFNF